MTENEKRILEMHGNVEVIMSEVKNITEWTKKHEASDKTHFDRIYKKVSSLYKYATSVAVVAGAVGFVVGIL